jgi:hypothetical protein
MSADQLLAHERHVLAARGFSRSASSYPLESVMRPTIL